MDTGKAIISGAAVLALGIVGGAYTYRASAPRYTMTNLGGGQALRLDARSGEVLSCVEAAPCVPVTGPSAKPAPTGKGPWDEFADAPANAT